MKNHPLPTILLFALFAAAPAASTAGELPLSQAIKALKSETSDANRLFSLSFFFEQAGRPFSALKAVRRAIEVDPEVPGYHARLGQLLMSRQRSKEAAPAYGKAAEMDPKTKSFRAAEARALTQSRLLDDASVSWGKLLEIADEPREVLDAARNLAGVHYELSRPQGAEKAWSTALTKLEKWENRIQAADAIVAAIDQQQDRRRAFEFWAGFLEQEKDWPNRASIADRMYRAANTAVEARADLLKKAVGVWEGLLKSAPNPPDKQRAAKVLAETQLRRGDADAAIEILRPHLFASKWSDNFGAAQTLARAYAALGDAKGRESLWREVLEKGANFNERHRAVVQLVAVIEHQEEAEKLCRELVKAFPKEDAAWSRLAATLQAASKTEEAANAYLEAIKAQRLRKGHRGHRESHYRNLVVQLLSQAGKSQRAVELIIREFRQDTNYWQFNSWLNVIRSQAGEYVALEAAAKFAQAGGMTAMGAGYYLNSHGQRDASLRAFEAVAAHKSLDYNTRNQALNQLINMARTGARRIELSKQRVALGGQYWQKQSAYSSLAVYLARQGEIEEGAAVVREAHKLRRHNHSAGPRVVQSLGSQVFQGNRVGPGLRTPEGLAKAEAAAQALYQQFCKDRTYRNQFSNLLTNLARLRARRGDTEGAIRFIRTLAQIKDRPYLRLFAAQTLEEKELVDDAFAEYLAYVEALASDHHENYRRHNASHRRHSALGLDNRLLQFLKKNKGDHAFEQQLLDRLQRTAGTERECLADAVFGFYKQRNRPEDMEKLLNQLKDWDHNQRPYTHLRQWVAGAIKMKNASSRADAQRRENLLNQLKSWQDTLARNPEDYQAAINTHKIYVQLGRKTEGEPYLEKAFKIEPRDPIILERYGRELMLDKAYKGAQRAFRAATEITGRQADYEESMVSSLALAGDFQEALDLALGSLEEGRNRGRGVRSVEQIMDMAERSDNLEYLHAAVKKRVLAISEQKKSLREDLARLSLRVAWDHNDRELSLAAVRTFLQKVRVRNERFQNERQLTSLAAQAKERGRLEEAVLIRQALLESHAARGQAPNVGEYRPVAMLLVESDKAQAAADLMFEGLSRAVQHGIVPGPRPQPIPIPFPVMIEDRLSRFPRRGGADRRPWQNVLVGRNVSQPWVSAILSMAALEAQSGGDAFQKACGDRLTALVEDEMKLLAEDPAKYRGPIVSSSVETGLKLRDRISAAFREAAKSKDATAETKLSLARRLVTLVTLQPKEQRDADIEFEEIASACDAVAELSEGKEKAKLLVQCGDLHARLLGLPEEERIEGVQPELALALYESAIEADAEIAGLDAYRKALAVAQAHKRDEKAVAYAAEVYRKLPNSENVRTQYAAALLRIGKADAAVEVLSKGLDQDSNYQEYQRAGATCLAIEDRPEAARAAIGFLEKALTLYIEEVGTQVDAKGQPVADRAQGDLQLSLLQANAKAGVPEKALDYFVSSMTNRSSSPRETSLDAVIAAYQKAEKMEELVTAIAAKVKEQPKELSYRLALAEVLVKKGDRAGAALAMQAAKAIKPELSNVKLLVELLREAGDHRVVLDECQAWADSFPQDADAWRSMAAIYKDLKDEIGEIRSLTMLVESAPREAANCREVAVTFTDRRDYVRATALMERAVELRPEEPFRHIDLAEVLFLDGELERSGKLCKEALTKDWEKGLSPELLARMPPWRGTFENRAHSILAEVYAATDRAQDAAKERMALPANYQRPALKDAIPTPRPRAWPWRRMR